MPRPTHAKADSPTAGRQQQSTVTTAARHPLPGRIQLLPLIKHLSILTKDGEIKPLGECLNYAQLDFIAECEHQLNTRGRIRICVLKARQIGISTIIEAIAFVLSMMYDNFKSKIVSHETESAQGILEMSRRYWETYPFRQFYTERYNGQNHLAWDNKSGVNVTTAKSKDAGRSQTIRLLHASEVAFWPDPDTLMLGLNQAIPRRGMNAIFLESTANGVGNYFHKQCTAAMKGESEYVFKFYPWHEHPEYTINELPEDEWDKYNLLVLDEEEMTLRTKHGIDDRRLMWRRYAIKNLCGGDVEKYHQEYPTTAHEAFISTGRNVFSLKHLLTHYEPRRGRRCKLIKVRDKIQIVDDPQGWLTIFNNASPDRDWGVYLIGGDPTHTFTGDYACMQVINRRTMEQVAVYRRKTSPIQFGKDMQLVGSLYNMALVAPEKVGPGYATVGCLVADDYPNVWATQKIDRLQGFSTNDVYGWVTSMQTKADAIAKLVMWFADDVVEIGNNKYGLIIHDEQTLLELRDYVAKEDGTGFTNSDGSEYDDGVMALAIAVAVHMIEPPAPPYEVVREDRAPAMQTAVAGSGGKVISGKSRPIDNQPTDRPVVDQVADRALEDSEAPWEAWGRSGDGGE